MKIIAAAAFVAAPWQPAHAQAIVGSIPEEFRGDWCQENTKDNIFKPGGAPQCFGDVLDPAYRDPGQIHLDQSLLDRALAPPVALDDRRLEGLRPELPESAD